MTCHVESEKEAGVELRNRRKRSLHDIINSSELLEARLTPKHVSYFNNKLSFCLSDFKKFIYGSFIHCWLYWVCTAAQGFSITVAGFSLQWLLCCRAQPLGCGLSNCGSWAWWPLGLWNLPGPRTEPVSPALAGRFLTTGPPGKTCSSDLVLFFLQSTSQWILDHTMAKPEIEPSCPTMQCSVRSSSQQDVAAVIYMLAAKPTKKNGNSV